MRHSLSARWIAGSAIAIAAFFVGASGVLAASDNNIASTSVTLSSMTAGATNVTMTVSATVGTAIASGESLLVNVESTCGVDSGCRFGTTGATLGVVTGALTAGMLSSDQMGNMMGEWRASSAIATGSTISVKFIGLTNPTYGGFGVAAAVLQPDEMTTQGAPNATYSTTLLPFGSPVVYGKLVDATGAGLRGFVNVQNKSTFLFLNGQAIGNGGFAVFGQQGQAVTNGTYTVSYFLENQSSNTIAPDSKDVTFSGLPIDMGNVSASVSSKTIRVSVKYAGANTAVTQGEVRAFEMGFGGGGGGANSTFAALDSDGVVDLSVRKGRTYSVEVAPGWGPNGPLSVDWAPNGKPTSVTIADNNTTEIISLTISVSKTTSKITGKVQDPKGAALANAFVNARTEGSMYSGTSDSTGAFTINLIGGQAYELEVFANSFDQYNFPMKRVELKPDESLDVGVIKPEELTGKIKGTITLDGTTTAAAEVRVMAFPVGDFGDSKGPGGPGPMPGGPRKMAFASTGTDGTYTLYVADKQKYNVELDRGGQNNYVYAGEPKTAEVGDDATVTGVNFAVKKTDATLRVHPVTSTGAPLDKLNFFAEARKDGADFGRGGMFGAPGFGGTAEIPVIAGVKYNVSVHVERDMFGSGGSDVNYSPAEDVLVTPGVGSKDVNVAMVRDSSTVQVLVQDQDGKTVTGKDGEVFLMNPTKMLFYHGQIDSDTGIASVTVAAGTYNYDVHLFGSAGEKGPGGPMGPGGEEGPGPGGEHFGPNDQPGGTPPEGPKEEDFFGDCPPEFPDCKDMEDFDEKEFEDFKCPPEVPNCDPKDFFGMPPGGNPPPGGITSLPEQGTISYENGVKVTSYAVGAGTSSDTTTYLPTPPGIGNSVTVADGATVKKVHRVYKATATISGKVVGPDGKPMFAFVEVSNGDIMKELKGENFDSGDIIMSGGEANPQTGEFNIPYIKLSGVKVHAFRPTFGASLDKVLMPPAGQDVSTVNGDVSGLTFKFNEPDGYLKGTLKREDNSTPPFAFCGGFAGSGLFTGNEVSGGVINIPIYAGAGIKWNIMCDSHDPFEGKFSRSDFVSVDTFEKGKSYELGTITLEAKRDLFDTVTESWDPSSTKVISIGEITDPTTKKQVPEFEITIQGNAFSDDGGNSTVRATISPDTSVPILKDQIPLDLALNIDIVDSADSPLTTASSNVTITRHLVPEEIEEAGIDLGQVEMAIYNETTGGYDDMGSVVVDEASFTLTGTTTSFSKFTATRQSGSSTSDSETISSTSVTENIALTPASGGGPNIQIYDRQGVRQKQFNAYGSTLRGGFGVVWADVDNDGALELVTYPTSKLSSHVRVFKADGTLVGQFFAYDQGFKSGLMATVGDVNADGSDEIIIGHRGGGGSNVRVYTWNATTSKFDLVTWFGPFASSFKGGVGVAAGDVNGDGRADIVTWPYDNGGPNIRVYTIGTDNKASLLNWYMPFASSFRGMLNVKMGDVDGDSRADIVTAVASKGSPNVQIYKWNTTTSKFDRVGWFMAYDASYKGGVELAVGDFNGSGGAEVMTAPTGNGGPNIRTYAYDATASTKMKLLEWGLPYDAKMKTGVNIAALDVDGNGDVEMVVAPRAGAGPNIRVYDYSSTTGKRTLSKWFWGFGQSFKGGVNIAE